MPFSRRGKFNRRKLVSRAQKVLIRSTGINGQTYNSLHYILFHNKLYASLFSSPRRQIHETFISTCWWSGLCFNIMNILLISPSTNMVSSPHFKCEVQQYLTNDWREVETKYMIFGVLTPSQVTGPHTSFCGSAWRIMCMHLHCQLIFQRHGGKGLGRCEYWIDDFCVVHGVEIKRLVKSVRTLKEFFISPHALQKHYEDKQNLKGFDYGVNAKNPWIYGLFP
jgi:hypothetical protein